MMPSAMTCCQDKKVGELSEKVLAISTMHLVFCHLVMTLRRLNNQGCQAAGFLVELLVSHSMFHVCCRRE